MRNYRKGLPSKFYDKRDILRGGVPATQFCSTGVAAHSRGAARPRDGPLADRVQGYARTPGRVMRPGVLIMLGLRLASETAR